MVAPLPGQSLTVEYVVTGSLDGTTPAPTITIDGSDPDATPFSREDQIYRVEVENLGLIDPDLGIGGSIGARCIPFFWIATDELGELGASLEVVGMGRASAPPRLQKLLEDLGGKAGTFYDAGFFVAQGSAIRLGGFVAGPSPIRVRVSILVPTTCSDFALGALATGPGGGGGDLCNSDPTAVTAGATASPGTAGESSRCDHRHAVPVGPPVTVIGSDNEQGSSDAFARADHGHRLELIGQLGGSLVGARPAVNVTGAGASLVDDPANDRLILDVPGTGVPLQTRAFTDDQTVDLVVGSQASDACVYVDLALSNANGEVTCYRLTLSTSPTGVGLDCPETLSDSPLTTVEPTAVVSGGQIIVRLVGSGPGTSTAAAYRVSDTLPRLLP